MKAKIQIEQIYEYLLAATLMCFCFAPKSISLFVILLVLFTGVQVVRKKMKFVFSPILLLFVLLYLAYTVGVLFTDHIDEALGYLEKKLVLVLFPILFSFRFQRQLDLKPITLGLVLGTIIVTVLSVMHATQLYYLTGDFNNSFGSSHYSYIHHPTYFAAIATMTLLLVREGVQKEWKGFNSWTLGAYFLLTCLNLLFCFSFASLIFFFLVIAITLAVYFYKRLPRALFLALIVLLPILPVAAYYGNVHVQIEIDNAATDLGVYVRDPNTVFEKIRSNPSGNQTRLLMWTISTQEFLAHPMGSGTANFDDKLGKRLRDKGLDDYADLKFNPHNQFLQVAVEIGVVGLAIFVSIFVCYFRMAKKYQFGLLFWLTLNLAFNSLFESMFQRQSGIVFYVLLFCLFTIYLQNRKPVSESESPAF